MTLGHGVSARINTLVVAFCFVFAIFSVGNGGGGLNRSTVAWLPSKSLCLEFLRAHGPEEAMCGERWHMSSACIADGTLRAAGAGGAGRRRRWASNGAIRRLRDTAKMSEAMLGHGRVWERRLVQLYTGLRS